MEHTFEKALGLILLIIAFSNLALFVQVVRRVDADMLSVVSGL